MKIEIWEEDQKEAEQPLRLRLVLNSGGVELRAVDKNGNWITSLLTIDVGGVLHLYEGVDEDLGLQLDKVEKLNVGKPI